jgi:hypothetical protein
MGGAPPAPMISAVPAGSGSRTGDGFGNFALGIFGCNSDIDGAIQAWPAQGWLAGWPLVGTLVGTQPRGMLAMA